MASDNTKAVLVEANARTITSMRDEFEDHGATVIYEAVGGVRPIAALAPNAVKKRTSTFDERPAARG